jgi:hypothetical protein
MLSLKKVNLPRVIGTSLGASAFFFLASNFLCWPGNPMYSADLGGLITCYAAGLPFLAGTVAGDLFYNAVLFGGFALVLRTFPELRTA